MTKPKDKVSTKKAAVIDFIKSEYRTILFGAMLIIITYKPVISYFTPVTYTRFTMLFDKNGLPRSFIRIEFASASAFLPNEKIKVKATYGIPNMAFFDQFGISNETWIRFDGSSFSDNSINIEQPDNSNAEDEKNKNPMLYEIHKGSNIASLHFNPTERKALYEKEIEIVYQQEGEHKISLWKDRITKLYDFDPIKISTPVDLLTKKTNDLLFIIAIINIAIAFIPIIRKKTTV